MDYPAFMAWLEDSTLGQAMRGSGVWTYALVNLTHVLGVATLFGGILVLDLRLVGLWRGIPLEHLMRPIVSMAVPGFVVAVLSGIGLITTNATEYVGNPFLLIKFPAIVLGLVNAWLIHRSAAWKAHRTRALTAPERTRLAAMGGTSLLCWLTAIGAGRMIGYW